MKKLILTLLTIVPLQLHAGPLGDHIDKILEILEKQNARKSNINSMLCRKEPDFWNKGLSLSSRPSLEINYFNIRCAREGEFKRENEQKVLVVLKALSHSPLDPEHNKLILRNICLLDKEAPVGGEVSQMLADICPSVLDK